MKSVLIYCRYTTTSVIFIRALGHLLSQGRVPPGLRFCLLLDDRRDIELVERFFAGRGVSTKMVYAEIRPFEKRPDPPLARLRDWENRYGAPHLRCYIENERAIEGKAERTKWSYLYAHIDYLERLWHELRPALFITGAAEGLLPWVAMAIARANGTRCISFSPGRFGQRSFILDNPYEILNVGSLYRRKLLEGLTTEEMSAVAKLVSSYRQGQVKPLDHLAVLARKRRHIINPFSAISLVRNACFTDIGNADLPLRRAVIRAVSARRTLVRNALLSRRIVRRLPHGEKFFFFPLQFEPEISLATQGRGWVNQRALIRLIANCLPVDRWLYVKEHPSMLSGIRPGGFYRDILKIPRVRLLDQRMSSHEIVVRAEAVTTITGTAGWEALMQGRPVVLFGHAFYEEFEDGVIRIDDIGRLADALREVRRREIPDKAIHAYVASVLERSHDGIFIDPRAFPHAAPTVLSETNLDAIGRAMLTGLGDLSA